MMTTRLVAGFLNAPTFVNIHEMYIVKTSWLLAVSFSTDLIGDLGAVRLFGNQLCNRRVDFIAGEESIRRHA